MATFTEDQIRIRARRKTTTFVSASEILNETVATVSTVATYDVFLSHSVKDAELVLGVKLTLEDHGKTVYVDWIEDPHLDRSRVNPATAQTLRQRMNNCRSLIYLHSLNSAVSKWMPWELGYFDGHKGAVAIFPLTPKEQASFDGQEYLGIYPYIDHSLLSVGGLKALKVHKSTHEFKNWSDWVSNPTAFRKTV